MKKITAIAALILAATVHAKPSDWYTQDGWTEVEDHVTVTFTMSMAKESVKPGGACEFRVWSGARTYDAATVRASSTGTDATVAKFRLTYQLSTGAKTLTAL